MMNTEHHGFDHKKQEVMKYNNQPGFRAYFMKFIFLLLGLLCLAGCSSCQKEPLGQRAVLEVVPPANWPILYDDLDAESFDKACQGSLSYLKRVPDSKVFSFGEFKRSASEMIKGIDRLREIFNRQTNPKARTEAIKEDFLLLRSNGSDGNGRVLFTGYYEPILKAMPNPQKPFVFPLYPVPQDLLEIDLREFGIKSGKRRLIARVKGRKVIPYYDRAEIDFEDALEKNAEPLAYLSDPVEAFFLHIQGSGQVVFPDGTHLRLGYAKANGHPYRSIGRYLIDKGLMTIDNMSMQAIKIFLEENKDLRKEVLSHNPSYVFFRPLPAIDGPLGCFEVPLTQGRSIATDRRIFPGLAPAYIESEVPGPDGKTVPMARFVLNQDTGGAIRGPGRVDVFFGSGYEPGQLAGRMKYEGRLYFLAPRRK